MKKGANDDAANENGMEGKEGVERDGNRPPTLEGAKEEGKQQEQQ